MTRNLPAWWLSYLVQKDAICVPEWIKTSMVLGPDATILTLWVRFSNWFNNASEQMWKTIHSRLDLTNMPQVSICVWYYDQNTWLGDHCPQRVNLLVFFFLMFMFSSYLLNIWIYIHSFCITPNLDRTTLYRGRELLIQKCIVVQSSRNKILWVCSNRWNIYINPYIRFREHHGKYERECQSQKMGSSTAKC